MVVKKYKVKNNILKTLIKYFWVIKASNQIINHKYLPVCNIDMVLNLGTEVKYVVDGHEIIVKNKLHFNGITDKYKLNIQNGNLYMLGISFFPTGLYPFIKIPLGEFKNCTIEFDQICKELNSEIISRIHNLDNIEEVLETLEIILLEFLDFRNIIDKNTINLFSSFSNRGDLTIENFSREYGVNKRRLERYFYKFIGTSPKTFSKIRRFTNVVKSLTSGTYDSLTSLALINNYYDQAHFIKEFKTLTGSVPSEFIINKSSLRDIITTS